jgi:Uma2 family endonuclease
MRWNALDSARRPSVSSARHRSSSVPLSPPPSLTAEELYAHPDRKRFELVGGRLRVREPVGGAHGRLAVRLAALLHAHVVRHGLGTVMVEAGYVLRRRPDTVRGPDVSFLSAARVAQADIPDRFINGTPDLAVEILSPEDRTGSLEEKLMDYFDAGVRLVWVADPRRRRIEVIHPDRRSMLLTASDALEGEDVVPGFRCPVAEVLG